MFNLVLMYPMMLLPTLPRMMWMLQNDLAQRKTSHALRKKRTYQSSKSLEYLIRSTIRLVKEVLGEQYIIFLAVSHFLVRWDWQRFIPLRPIELMFVTAPEFHPRGS
jgi:hypothetical protein